MIGGQMYRSAFQLVMASLMVVSSTQAGELLKFRRGSLSLAGAEAQLAHKKLNLQKEIVIQFKNRITAKDKSLLKQNHIQVLRYLPDDAYIVKVESEMALDNLKKATQIQGVIEYTPMMKISPDMDLGSVFNQNEVSQVVVQFFTAAQAEQAASIIQQLSPMNQVLAVSGKALVVQASKRQVNEIAKLGGVELIQPYVEMKTLQISLTDDEGTNEASSEPMKGDYTDLSGFESGTKLMNLDKAWDRGFNGKGQIVGMADTGLDSGDANQIHTDFAGAVSAGFYYGAFATSWSDPMGHGTHVAGSIMGRGAASGGLLKGGAYEASMVAQGMWSPLLGGLSVPPKMAKMLDDAYKAGARVHSNSWGGARNLGAYDAFAQQADDYMWNHQDFLLVFAAGNSGEDANKDGRIDPGSVSSPGTAKNVLTVGASENTVSKGGIQEQIKALKSSAKAWSVDPINSDYLSNNADGMACFSSRGPTTDGRIKPEIAAPGTNVLSVHSQVEGADALWGLYNNDYAFSGGTSMATPLTSGAIAVARQYINEKLHLAEPSAALVKAYMMHTAYDMYPGQFGEVGASKGQELLVRRPNADEGFGRVDMDKATAITVNSTQLVDEKTGVALNEVKSYDLNLTQDSKVIINLVYTDAPGSPNAAKVLVNNLDLEITQNGQNIVTKSDDTNNFEFVEQVLSAGQYSVRVIGKNVPQGINGKQAFGLVIGHY